MNVHARDCRTKFTQVSPTDIHYVLERSNDENVYVGCIETVNTVDLSEWYDKMNRGSIRKCSSFNYIKSAAM